MHTYIYIYIYSIFIHFFYAVTRIIFESYKHTAPSGIFLVTAKCRLTMRSMPAPTESFGALRRCPKERWPASLLGEGEGGKVHSTKRTVVARVKAFRKD